MKYFIYTFNAFFPRVFKLFYKKYSIRFTLVISCLFSLNFSYAQPPGEALLFDGSASYVQLSDTITGSYTKEAWINTNNIFAYNNIISGTATAFLAPNGVLSGGNAYPWNTVTDNTTPLDANTWYHVAITYDAVTQVMNLYKNGVLVGTASGVANYIETTPATIGSYKDAAVFSGLIDEVSIWNYARSGADIAASMNCPLTGNEPGLTAYYNFNDGLADGNNPGVTTLTDASDRKCTADNGTLLHFALTTGSTSNWEAPGVVLSGGCTIIDYAVIKVTGNAACIINGESTPSVTDSTSFGRYTGSPVTVNYVIKNGGVADLNIDSIRIGGADAANFSITGTISSPILSGASEVIQVTFSPISYGNKSAVLNIYSNDSAALTFGYTIQCNNPAPGASLSFDGANDYVQLPFILAGSYTKEAWINTNDVTSFRNIISGSQEAFAINASGQVTAGNGFPFATVVDPTPLLPNTWYHVAVTYDFTTNEMNLYKNGVLVANGNDVSPFTDNALYIGAFQGLATWSGNIDEVRIWKSVRTQAQINNSMSCTLTGDEFGLQAYYNFSNGFSGIDNTGIPAGNVLYDLSNKCQIYNGQLENFTLNGAVSNWVSDSPAVAGPCVNTYPNIKVTGNTVCIEVNNTTISTGDNTDYGLASAAVPSTKTYIIVNNGLATLNIDSSKAIGTDSLDFVVTSPPASAVVPGGSTSITVSFIPTEVGTRDAFLAIYNNDSDEAPFQFAIEGEGTIVLPVNFLSFNAVANGATANLTWRVNASPNNKGFEILRSSDGFSNWVNIGFVTATPAATYNFTDATPLAGVNTYKLQQIDADGNSVYSSIQTVDFLAKAGIALYPNPVKDNVTIVTNTTGLLNTPIQLSTITGKVIFTTTLIKNQQQIDMGKLPQGIYLLSFNNGEVKRIVKQ